MAAPAFSYLQSLIFMPLSIEYHLVGSGWADCTVCFNEIQCDISASYLSDALGKLILAAAAIATGAHSVSVGFDEEPGEYRWVVVQSGHNQVNVRLLEFQSLWGNEPDSQGELLMEFAVSPLEFAVAVETAASKVLEKHGAEEYEKKWAEHKFPQSQLELLRELIGHCNANLG